MSIVRRAVVGAAVLGAGLASTAGLASAATNPPGVDAALAAADAAVTSGTHAGLAGAQAGLSAANSAAHLAQSLGGYTVPGVPPFSSISQVPGLTQGLNSIPSAAQLSSYTHSSPSSFGDPSKDPAAFQAALKKSLSGA